MHRVGFLLLVPVFAGVMACSGDSDGPSQEFTLTPSPEFVNRLIPGYRPLALVALGEDESDGVELRATTSLAGGSVTVEPEQLTAGGVSEVWIEIPEVVEEVAFSVTVTGRRGSVERTVTINATAVPGTDDLEGTALDIAGFFLGELGDEAPELPDQTSELTGGTPVAGLLVVSHYAWFTADYEIGLQWHIMVAPDDFAELYIRPRDELMPTRAFRVNSWSQALAGGPFMLEEVSPAAEVTR